MHRLSSPHQEVGHNWCLTASFPLPFIAQVALVPTIALDRIFGSNPPFDSQSLGKDYHGILLASCDSLSQFLRLQVFAARKTSGVIYSLCVQNYLPLFSTRESPLPFLIEMRPPPPPSSTGRQIILTFSRRRRRRLQVGSSVSWHSRS